MKPAPARVCGAVVAALVATFAGAAAIVGTLVGPAVAADTMPTTAPAAAAGAAAESPAPPTVDSLCAAVAAPASGAPSTLGDEVAFARLLRTDTAAALADACSRRDDPEPAIRHAARRQVASALVQDARNDDAAAILPALLAAADARGDEAERGELLTLAGSMAFEESDLARVRTLAAQARAALTAAGRLQSHAHFVLLVLDASVARADQSLDRAEALLDQAQALLDRLGLAESFDAGDLLNARTMLANQRQDWRATTRWGWAEIELGRRLSRHPDADPELLHAYATLGVVHSRLGEYDEAERALAAGLRIIDAVPDADLSAQLGVLQNLSTHLLERGRVAEALPLAERAAALAERRFGHDGVGLLRVLLQLALCQEAVGELGRADATYARIRAIAAAQPGNLDLLLRARVAYGQAVFHATLGDAEAAQRHVRELRAAVAGEPGYDWWRGQAARIACAQALAAQRWAEAERECTAMQRDFIAALDPGHALVTRAIVARCAAQSEGALPGDACAETRRRIGRRGADGAPLSPQVRYLGYAALAREQSLRHRPQRAAADLTRALALAETLGLPDPLWSAYAQLADNLAARGQRQRAILFGKLAIAQVERLRHSLDAASRNPRDLDRGYVGGKVGLYRRVTDWLMEAGRLDEAMAVLRLLKAQEIDELAPRRGGEAALDTPSAELLTPGEQAQRERYRQVLAPVLPAEARSGELERLLRLHATQRIAESERRRMDELLASNVRQEDDAVLRLGAYLLPAERGAGAPRQRAPSSAPSAAQSLTLPMAALERERRRYGPDAALAFTLLTPTRLRLLIATAQGQMEVVRRVDAADLRRRIGRFLEAIEARREVDADARSLYALLAEPIDRAARRAGARRLVLWLDDALRYVPWAALSDGRGELVERYAIQRYAVDDGGSAAAEAEEPQTVRGLGVTRAVAGFPALAAVADELCAIVDGPIEGLAPCAAPSRAALAGAGYADAAFTEARVRSLLQARHDFAYLHVGTHFELRPGHAARSYMVLGDGRRMDLQAIAGLDFGGLELVTLSACQTGMDGARTAGDDDGREVEGLSALVQRRGAGRVIASLWAVEDASTASLMTRLYAGLARRRLDAAAAMREAQLALRAERPHPYYWAGFVVSGARP